MKAIKIERPGGPEVLKLVQGPAPVPGDAEVLVKVAAAGVNRPDILQRKGQYSPPPGVSDTPGLEIAGTVAGIGPGDLEWKIGDRVCALVAGGGYAEYCTAPAVQCLPVPRGLSFVEAASLPETFFTVWSNVFDRGKLRSGESFLVQGGSSGIGVAAIQMARAFGARVFATAGSGEKCEACQRLGAERAINYKTEDFVEVVKNATAGRGVDVILDMIGGDYVPRELHILADEGRLVFISGLRGLEARFDIMELMRRRATLTGSTLRARSAAFKGSVAAALRTQVWPLIESGKIKPMVYKTFPLERAADAHRLLESGAHIGKIMLTIE
jgi:NADPH2:quinone reductase